jgi:ubiquinone/menaquinone biosynthesis C-methylase UbiE
MEYGCRVVARINAEGYRRRFLVRRAKPQAVSKREHKKTTGAAMLQRILEPEVMDTAAEAADYDTMDHAEVNRVFVNDFLQALGAIDSSVQRTKLRVLDLGTGTAQIPIELCGRSERTYVVAVDAARHMLELANRNIAAAGLSERMETQLCDAKRLPFADGQFDCVVSNSIVHHLPGPIAVLREALRVTRAGGLLFFRDLLRPDSAEERERLVDLYAPATGISPAGDHQRAMFSDSLNAALALVEIRSLVAELGFPIESVEVTSDRHWTWRGVL